MLLIMDYFEIIQPGTKPKALQVMKSKKYSI